jgi:hypothetical protein
VAPAAISVEFRKSRRSIGVFSPRGSEALVEERRLSMAEVFSAYDKPFRLALILGINRSLSKLILDYLEIGMGALAEYFNGKGVMRQFGLDGRPGRTGEASSDTVS